ncbi:hypothetical protein DFP79_1281 [Marinomonas balearica]|uniref:Uncharacterized protein n=1 Tax=Marinomonas balearica TaxID=491947 RepID=A0A4R6MBA1_9GAMM|nr:hypothetical protein DFP79_1281 [Marinomonas balearica]
MLDDINTRIHKLKFVLYRLILKIMDPLTVGEIKTEYKNSVIQNTRSFTPKLIT